MEKKYINNLGILVGTFDETDLKTGKDKEILKKYKEKYPEYNYTNTAIIKENNVKKLAIYICNAKDFKIKI